MTADTLKTTRVLELYQDFLSGPMQDSAGKPSFYQRASREAVTNHPEPLCVAEGKGRH